MILRCLILPHCRISTRQVEMIVDDVVAVCPGFLADTVLTDFDSKYRSIVASIGLSSKPDDDSGYKAFSNRLNNLPLQKTKYHYLFCRSTGEVLGFLINSTNHTWSLSPDKSAKILQTIDLAYNKYDLHQKVYITIKLGQRILGKLTALSAVFPAVNQWICFLSRDLSVKLKKWPAENKLSEQQQSRVLAFSFRARRDLHFIRAIIASLKDHWIPIVNPDRPIPVTVHVVVHTDASCQLNTPPGQPGPALGIIIPVQVGVVPRAASFVLDRNFLCSFDQRGQNAHNTSLVECFSILVTLIRWPNTFLGKSVVFVTDNSSLVANFKKRRPRGLYLCYVMRCVYNVADRLSCDLHVTWQARCSSLYSTLVDQLSHQNFTSVPEVFQYRVIEDLPLPLKATLQSSYVYKSNTFHKLWSRILHYWQIHSRY